MPDRKNINLFLFMCIAFLLPIGSVYLQESTRNSSVKFILYGIQAAAPSIAAILITVKERNFWSFLWDNFNKKKIIIALLLPIIIAFCTMLLAKAIACLLIKEHFAFGSISGKQVVIIAWALIAEEFGWRGYLQPFLSKQMRRAYLAPFLVGIIWGLWHYHYFLSGGMQVPVGWFFVGCIVESYIYACLLEWSDRNLLSAMIYHFAWNLFIHVFALNPVDNMGNQLPYMILTILEVIFCLLLFFTGKMRKQHSSN